MNIQIEKPRLGVPVSLIVDDPTPCVNPLYYFRVQVDHEASTPHEPTIPLDFLEQFIAVSHAHGIRGKWSVIPYPAGLGSIVDAWPGCDRHELNRWIELTRTELAPDFDITPEILTHTLALDLRTHRLLEQPEHIWMAERSYDELAEYFSAGLALLKQAGFAPTGITQPCYFNGSRDDYNRAALQAIRGAGGPPVTFYFIDGYFEGAPFPPPEVVLLDRERGEAVVSIIDYCHDYFWPTQRPTSIGALEVVDRFITVDGSAGRLVELAQGDAWLIFVCHWQSLYSDGTRQGLAALDEVAARLARVHGPRLNWLTLGEIARYRAATEGCDIALRPTDDGFEIELQAAFDCPDFTFSVQAPAGIDHADVVLQAPGESSRPLQRDDTAEGLLSAGAWRETSAGMSFCFGLRRGRQVVKVHHRA